MRKYVLKRIGLALVTCFIILSVTFLLMKLLPFQEPIGQAIDKFRYYNDQFTQGFVLRFEEEKPEFGKCIFTTYGSNIFDDGTAYYFYVRPVFDQYLSWLGNIFTKWDWGVSTSIQVNVDAMTIIGSRLPTTISINIWASLISVPLGILLGIWAALKKNKPTDHIISTIIMVFISVPSFIIISLLIKFLAYDTGLLPSSWPTAGSPIGMKIEGYIIPVMSLCFGSICGYCRFTRAELCEVMSSDYLLLARTKGLTKTQCITRHALRNAMVPIVPSILAEFISVLSGSMILENLYNIPGIGTLFVNALNTRDYSVLIDPRIRMGAKNNG